MGRVPSTVAVQGGIPGFPGYDLAVTRGKAMAELYRMDRLDAGISRFDSGDFRVVPGTVWRDGKDIYPCVLSDGESELAFTDSAYAALYAMRREVLLARLNGDYGKARRRHTMAKEKEKTYEVTCRTYTAEGEFMNAETFYVDVPERIYTGSDDDIVWFLRNAVSDDMDERCDDDDGEAYWEIAEWGETTF